MSEACFRERNRTSPKSDSEWGPSVLLERLGLCFRDPVQLDHSAKRHRNRAPPATRRLTGALPDVPTGMLPEFCTSSSEVRRRSRPRHHRIRFRLATQASSRPGPSRTPSHLFPNPLHTSFALKKPKRNFSSSVWGIVSPRRCLWLAATSMYMAINANSTASRSPFRFFQSRS